MLDFLMVMQPSVHLETMNVHIVPSITNLVVQYTKTPTLLYGVDILRPSLQEAVDK